MTNAQKLKPSRQLTGVKKIPSSKKSFRSEGSWEGATAQLAYSFWEQRGRTDGYAEQDWSRAEQKLSAS
jgi:hypothetical protein